MADFDDFFLKEYERVSEAHFTTVNLISQFMRHYLVIASLPLALAVLFVRPSDAGVIRHLSQHPGIVALPLLGVAVIGFCIAVYVIALHHDAVLYARTVNGVRAYFVGRAKEDEKPHIVRVLPTDVNVPQFGWGTFSAVVGTFATVNSGYALGALYAYSQPQSWRLTCLVWLFPSLFWLAHFLAYYRLSVRQQRKWEVRP